MLACAVAISLVVLALAVAAFAVPVAPSEVKNPDRNWPWVVRSTQVTGWLFGQDSLQGVAYDEHADTLVLNWRQSVAVVDLALRPVRPATRVAVLRNLSAAPWAPARYTHIGDTALLAPSGGPGAREGAREGPEWQLVTAVEDAERSLPVLLALNQALDPDWICVMEGRRHASFVAGGGGVLYSTEFHRVHLVYRYRRPAADERLAPVTLSSSRPRACDELPPLQLSRDGLYTEIREVQGGSFHDGLLYLTTNQVNRAGSVFVVDAATGSIVHVLDLAIANGAAETEGIAVFSRPRPPERPPEGPPEGPGQRDSETWMVVLANLRGWRQIFTFLELGAGAGAGAEPGWSPGGGSLAS